LKYERAQKIRLEKLRYIVVVPVEVPKCVTHELDFIGFPEQSKDWWTIAIVLEVNAEFQADNKMLVT
jgi:hypothetical protein